MAIKIVVDSGCDLTEKIKKDNNIISVPLNLFLGDRNFIDDDSLDKEKFLSDMTVSKELCKTAAPAPKLFLDAYKGLEDIFVVTLSSELSGSYNSAKTASRLYLEDIGKKFIHVFDSLSASVGETLIALKINELARLDFSKQKIIDGVNNFISGMNTYFILEKFDNFVKSGRISPCIARLASFFNIKPICKGKDGKPVLADKARGYDRAIEKLINMINKTISNPEEKILGITHVKCLKKAIELKNRLLEKVNFKDVIIMSASGLCSVYADLGGLIVAY